MSKMSKKVAYLKGLAEGLGIDGQGDSGKLMNAMIQTMEALADELEDTQEKLHELMEYVEEIDGDLSDLEEAFYSELEEDEDDEDEDDEDEDDEDEDDDEDDDGMIEYECPYCGTVIFFDEQAFDMEQEHLCPNCHRKVFDDDTEEDGGKDDGDED